MRRLIVRPGAIGDTIVSLPALERLACGDCEIWAPEQNLPLLRHLAPARSLFAMGLDALELSPATLARLASFDEIISWYGARNDAFRAQLRPFNTRFLPVLPGLEVSVHAVDFYLDQVGAPRGAVPRLPVKRADKGYAVIHPFSSSARKNWPLEQFRQMAARLPLPVRWCAGPEEPLAGASRFDDLGALARWLAGASVYVGNDSGITHLAAACGVPVVALFGPHSRPEVWAPRGPEVTVIRFQAAESERGGGGIQPSFGRSS
jgi:ADP-heptose:LPS heptosyltransferase